MSRTPKCCCNGCNAEGTVKVDLYRRGGRNVYMCAFHAEELESYYTKNNYHAGNVKKNGFTYGVELETSFSTEKARAEIVAAGYIPTYDCTVDVEYKSPIMNGLNGFSKQCKTFQRLIDDGQLEINSSCGTHIHVGHADYINKETIEYLRTYYIDLFLPLSEAMVINSWKVEELFGRDFGHWAQPIDEYTDPTEHTNFINLQHDKTVEFRICKFNNADQMMNAVRFVRAAGAILVDFIKKCGNEKLRRHNAKLTAIKLVTLFEESTK